MTDSLGLKDELIKVVGEENYSDNEFDLLCYSSDVASLPPEIFRVYGVEKPLGIVKPTTVEQVAAAVRLANKYGVPITVRGGGSSGLGGVLPVGGGLVVDLTCMKQILELNEAEKTITVQPGITWKELLDFLAKRGLAPGVYPSSAYSATVGGFIAMGGYFGIGAYKYGSIKDQIVNLEVVLPTGEIVNTSTDGIPAAEIPADCSWIFIASEGIFGIITKVTLRIYSRGAGFEVCAVAFDKLDDAYAALSEALKKAVKPHTLHIVDENFLENAKKMGSEVPVVGGLITAAFEAHTASEAKAHMEKLLAICAAMGGRNLGSEIAEKEWENRFKVELLFKRLGPTLLLIEVAIPVDNVPQTVEKWSELAKKRGLKLSHFGMLGSSGLVNLIPMVLVDERDKGRFIKTVAILMEMLNAGLEIDGKIHAVGLHYSPYAKSKLGVKIEELQRIKSAVDPQNLMNPYKVVKTPLPVWMLKTTLRFMAGSPAWLDSFVLKLAGTPIVKVFRG